MFFRLDEFEWLTPIVWLSVLLSIPSVVIALFVSLRFLRLSLNVAWIRQSPQGILSFRPWLLTAAIAIASALALLISRSETFAVRLATLLVIATVTYVFFDWAWKAAVASSFRRSTEARAWHERSSAASETLIKLLDPEAIPQTACHLLHSHLDCAHACLYLAAFDGRHRIAAFTPAPPPVEVCFSTSSLLHEELGASLQPRALPVFDPRSMLPVEWSHRAPEHLAEEQALLSSLNACLVVPLRHDLKVRGFFVLGPPTSGQIYEPHHLSFAETVASQASRSLITAETAAVALQRTTDTAQEQASRRSARSTRGHLAPPDRFELPGLEFAAQYWNGDVPGTGFYDVLQLPQRSAMFILADIPGPAEDAAVRLVQIQALLRTRARAYCEDLGELLESTRRAIVLSAAARPSVSLFCARYSSSNRLHFVNAGHYPPLLMRRTPEGAEISRLTTGGPALSAGSPASFEEGEVELNPGDLIAIGSASIPSVVNAEAQTWGESSFVNSLLEWENQDLREMAHHTLASALDFSSNDPNQPPRTIILLRPCSS